MEIKSSTLCDFIYGKEVSLEKLVDLGGGVLLDKESNEDIYEDVHVFKPKFNSISEVYEELKDKKLNLDKTIDCAAPHYMSNILGNPVVEVLYSGSEIYIHSLQVLNEPCTDGEIYEYEIDDDDFINVIISFGLGEHTLRLSS